MPRRDMVTYQRHLPGLSQMHPEALARRDPSSLLKKQADAMQ